MQKYDAIIIGSGPGGLAAGLLLAHSGKKVLMLEKNNSPGGRIASYKRDGFAMDFGVHVISRGAAGPMGDVLRRTGVEHNLQFTSVRPVSSYNKKTFIFPHDLKDMVSEEEYAAVKSFLKDIRSFTDEEVSSYDDITVEEFLNRYTKNPLACSCIWMVTAVYMCLPLWEASAGEFMRCLRYESAARSSGYPEGGCKAITDVYIDGIKRYGGELRLGTKVERIAVENGRAKGVYIGDELVESDMVISNGDIKVLVNKLVGPEHFPPEYVNYVTALKYSWSGSVIKLGLDKKLTDIKMLSQFGSLDQKAYADGLAKGIVPDEVNLFLVVPSNFSDAVAPEGMQVVNFTTTMPLGLPREFEDKMMERMLDTAEEYIPGLRDHIVFEERVHISAVESWAEKGGAGIGIGQVPGQVGKSRPSVKLPVEGLYIVGACAGGSGVGAELAINSAIEFFDNYGVSS